MSTSRGSATSISARRRVATPAAMVAVLSLSIAAAAPAAGTASASTTQHSYTASAFGTSANVGSVVKSGRSAALTLGCTTNGNLHQTNSAAGLSLAPLANTGAISTTVDSYASPIKSASSARTASVSLLNGLVQATAVKSVSSTTRSSSGFALSSSGTTLTGLVVGGRSVSASAAPNTRINLAGFGYLVVNEQIRRTNGLTVNGLHLVVSTKNALGVAVGSNVVVSNAVSALSGPVAGVVGGYSYGTSIDLAGKAVSGPSFTAYLPCLGTSGVVRENTGATVALGTTLRTGTIRDTVQGEVTSTTVTGRTTSTVQAVQLLNDLVRADTIKANASVSRTGGVHRVTSDGSSFVNLRVKGHANVTAKVAPNTQVALPGVGTLYLHRVLKKSNSVHVIMVQLVLTSPVNGLAAGSDIRVGVAKATVT